MRPVRDRRFERGRIGHRALQQLLVVAALLDRLLDAQLRDRLGRLLVARLGLLDAPPAGDRLVELPEPGQRLRGAAIHGHVLRRRIERPAQHVELAFVAADLLVGVGHVEQRGDVPGFDFSASHAAGNASRHWPLPAALLSAIPRAAVHQRREPRALFVVAVFLRQVAEKVLQVDEIGRVVDQALRVQIVRVVVVGLFGAALRMLENGLQPLPHRRRHGRQAAAIRFAWLLSRHDACCPVCALSPR